MGDDPTPDTMTPSQSGRRYGLAALLGLTVGLGSAVAVTMGGASDHASLAVYDANTDNVLTINDRLIPRDGITPVVLGPDTPVTVEPGEPFVRLRGPRGLVLIRRLAPTDSAFARVERERTDDRCAPLSAPERTTFAGY